MLSKKYSLNPDNNRTNSIVDLLYLHCFRLNMKLCIVIFHAAAESIGRIFTPCIRYGAKIEILRHINGPGKDNECVFSSKGQVFFTQSAKKKKKLFSSNFYCRYKFEIESFFPTGSIIFVLGINSESK